MLQDMLSPPAQNDPYSASNGMDLIAHAQAFKARLRGTRDSEARYEQRGQVLADKIDTFVKAWQDLSDILRGAQLPRQQTFDDTLSAIREDNLKIYIDLSQKLEDSKTRSLQARKTVRIVLGHKAGHPLIVFFGREATDLRKQQIIYATAAIKLITSIVLHARSQGYRHAPTQEKQAARERQHRAIEQEGNARNDIILAEGRTSDNLLSASTWLDDFTNIWNPSDWDITDRLPLQRIADHWFSTPATQRHATAAQHATGNEEETVLAQLVAQLQHEVTEIRSSQLQAARQAADTNNELRNQLAAQQIQMNSQNTQIQGQKVQLDVQRDQLNAQGIRIQNDANTIAQLRQSQEQLRKIATQANTRGQNQEQKIQRLETRLQQTTTELAALQRKYNNLVQAYNNAQSDLKRLEKSNQKLEKDREALRKDLGKAEREQDALGQQNARLQKQIDSSAQSDQRLRDIHNSQVRELKAQVQSLAERNEELEQSVACISNDYKRISADNRQLHEELKMAGENALINQDQADSPDQQPRASRAGCPPLSYKKPTARRGRSDSPAVTQRDSSRQSRQSFQTFTSSGDTIADNINDNHRYDSDTYSTGKDYASRSRASSQESKSRRSSSRFRGADTTEDLKPVSSSVQPKNVARKRSTNVSRKWFEITKTHPADVSTTDLRNKHGTQSFRLVKIK